MPAVKEVSLLPKEADNNSLFARTLRWLTSVGRVIIIFTELIVIAAFLSRFWLDRKNSDLSETLRQQKAIIGSTKEFENEYLSLQNRLTTIKKFYSLSPRYADFFKSISQSLPPDVYLQSLSFERDDKNSQILVKSKLYSYQEDSLVNFVTNASLNPDIHDVSVERIEKRTKDSKYYLDAVISFKKDDSA